MGWLCRKSTWDGLSVQEGFWDGLTVLENPCCICSGEKLLAELTVQTNSWDGLNLEELL